MEHKNYLGWIYPKTENIASVEDVSNIILLQKGNSNGLATLDGAGKVPTNQLPSYVDDVLEFEDKSEFPSTGEEGKIYVDADSNYTYRWTGNTYILIGGLQNLVDGVVTGSIRSVTAVPESEIYHLGNNAIALGTRTKSSGIASNAEGFYTEASGDGSHVEGYAIQNNVGGYGEIKASGKGSHALGYSHAYQGSNSAIIASGRGAHALGYAYDANTVASGDGSHAEGYVTKATGNYSHAEGTGTASSGQNAHALGYYTTATASNAHAEGLSTTASGANAHAEGYHTTASGSLSHAEGNLTKAAGVNSHAEGSYTLTGNNASGAHAEGLGDSLVNSVQANGVGSHAEGLVSGTNASIVASGAGSHAEGCVSSNQQNLASGVGSHVEGSATKATAVCAHAEGNETTASGVASHAEGYQVKASGVYSHALGWNATSSGPYSHALGLDTIASGQNSHVSGIGTTGQRRSQTVIGEYNVLDTTGTTGTRGTYAFIIGNGNSTSARSNALTVTWDGVVESAGIPTLATHLTPKSYVDSNILDLSSELEKITEEKFTKVGTIPIYIDGDTNNIQINYPTGHLNNSVPFEKIIPDSIQILQNNQLINEYSPYETSLGNNNYTTLLNTYDYSGLTQGTSWKIVLCYENNLKYLYANDGEGTGSDESVVKLTYTVPSNWYTMLNSSDISLNGLSLYARERVNPIPQYICLNDLVNSFDSNGDSDYGISNFNNILDNRKPIILYEVRYDASNYITSILNDSSLSSLNSIVVYNLVNISSNNGAKSFVFQRVYMEASLNLYIDQYTITFTSAGKLDEVSFVQYLTSATWTRYRGTSFPM